VATLDIAPTLPPNRADGTLAFEVKPPAGGSYVDRRENTAVLVVRGYDTESNGAGGEDTAQ
jgi:hypothetical protein